MEKSTLFILLLIGCTGVASIMCPEGWLLHSPGFDQPEACVKTFNSSANWLTARRTCRENNGFLLKLSPNTSRTILYEVLPDFFPDTQGSHFWTGLHVHEVTGRLVWDEMEPLTAIDYLSEGVDLAWADGQPDDSKGKCVSLSGNTTFGGFGLSLLSSLDDCSNSYGFACERPAVTGNVSLNGPCYVGWYSGEYSDKCYKANLTQSTRDQSDLFCKLLGGDGLAEPTSQLDLVYLNAVLGEISNVNSGVFFWTNIMYDSSAQVLTAGGSNRIVNIDITGNLNLPLNNSGKFCGQVSVGPQLQWVNCSTERAAMLCETSKITHFIRPELYLQETGRLITNLNSTYDDVAVIKTNRWSTLNFTLSTYSGTDVFYQNWEVNQRTPSSQYDMQGFYWFEVWQSYPLKKEFTNKVLLIDNFYLTYRGEITVYDWFESLRLDMAYYNLFGVRQASLSEIFTIFDANIGNLLGRQGWGNVNSRISKFKFLPSPSFVFVVCFDIFLERSNPVSLIDEEVGRINITNKLNSSLTEWFTFVQPIVSADSLKILPTRQCIGGIYEGWTVPSGGPSDYYDSYEMCVETYEPAWTANCTGNFLVGLEWTVTIQNCSVMVSSSVEPTTYSPSTKNGSVISSTTFSPPTTEGSVMVSPTTSYKQLPTEARNFVNNQLEALSEEVINSSTSFSVADSVSVISASPNQINKMAVKQITNILEKIAAQPTIDTQSGGRLCRTIDNLARVDPVILTKSQQEQATSTRLLQALQQYTEKAVLDPEDHIRQTYDSFAVEMWNLNSGNVVYGIKLEQGKTVDQTFLNQSLETLSIDDDDDDDDNPDDIDGVDVAIFLPPSLVEDEIAATAAGDDLRLSFVVHTNMILFMDESTNGTLLDANIIAASLGNQKIQNLSESQRIRSVFYSTQNISGGSPVCVFWDFSLNNNRGGWSEDGCRLNSTRDDGYYECSCDHLTNFAVLIDFGDKIDDVNNTVLTIITVIGLCLSILGLTITILTFILFRKTRKENSQKTLFCLSLALLVTCILFLIGVILSQENLHDRVSCQAVAVLLHYFLLASFMWMLVEAVLQYLSFVKVMNTYIPHFIKKASVAAWGIPLIPVIIVLAISPDLYYRSASVTKFCWIDQFASYFAFALPVGLVIIANAVVFARIVWAISHRPKGLQSNQSQSKTNLISLKAAIACFILLGLTWVFAFLAIEDARLFFQYIFTILCAFQGFFIFIIFTARDKKVRQYWKSLCCKQKDRKSAYSTSSEMNTKRPSQDVTTSTADSSSGRTSNGHKYDETGNLGFTDNNAMSFSNKSYRTSC